LGCGDFERFEAEAFHDGEDIVGGFGPAEGFWIILDRVDVGSDRRFQLFGGAMDAASDLLFGMSVKKRSTRFTQELAVGVK
jgi:hypothetical protein